MRIWRAWASRPCTYNASSSAPLCGRRERSDLPVGRGSRLQACICKDAVAVSPATGDRQGVAGDVACLVGGQEQDGVGHLERLAEPMQRRHPVWAVLDRLIEV